MRILIVLISLILIESLVTLIMFVLIEKNAWVFYFVICDCWAKHLQVERFLRGLKYLSLDFKNCLGQGYAGAATFF